MDDKITRGIDLDSFLEMHRGITKDQTREAIELMLKVAYINGCIDTTKKNISKDITKGEK